MKLPKINLGLPLLTKELTEQAARRRTYEIRIAYAVMLFLIAYYFSAEILRLRSFNQFSVLGRGGRLFEALIGIQFAGIYLFMPAISCGMLTTEKERGTLGLLFITRLGPWTILVEKLLGRIVPMFSFLLLSLPLLVFSYSLGGLAFRSIWVGFWFLAITVVQVGCISLFCSAYFRTTITAYLACYLIGLALYFLPPFFFITNRPFFYSPEVLMFFGPAVFFNSIQQGSSYVGLYSGLPILFSSLLFFALAGVFLVRRAFIESRNYLLIFFHRLDRFFIHLNDRFTRGIVLVRDSVELPLDKPIEWMETNKRSLGTYRYLARVFVLLEVPIVFFCSVAAILNSFEGISIVAFIIWIIAILFIAVKSSSLVSGERTRSTLDVLLVTPMTGQEIVMQKIRGIRRLMYVLAIPLFTIIILEAIFFVGLDNSSGVQSHTFFYLLASTTCVYIYFHLSAWISLYIGLYSRTQTRAMFGALATLVAWCVIPLATFSFFVQFSGIGRYLDEAFAVFLSPAAFPVFLEIDDNPRMFVMYIFNTLIYGGALVIVRMACLLRADKMLNRTGTI